MFPPVQTTPDQLVKRDEIAKLLTAGHYQEAIELLYRAHQISLESADSINADLLAAAIQICLTAAQTYRQMEAARQTLQQMEACLVHLNSQLQSVLAITDRLVSPDGDPGVPSRPSLTSPAVPPIDDDVDCPEQPKSRRSWKDLLSLIRRDSALRLSLPERTATPLVDSNSVITDERCPTHGLTIYCLGTFEIYRNRVELIVNGSSRKATLIFKYLLLNREHPTRKEYLMDLFWPDFDEQAQRNSLNVAVYHLRQMLRNGGSDFSYILFQNDCYRLNPDLELWADYEAFLERYRAGQRAEQEGKLAEAVQDYRRAETLYQGEFLPDDPYEEWLEPRRHFLQDAYLTLLQRLSAYAFDQQDYNACIAVLNKMLATDMSIEEAHCQLMRCYSRLGQPYLALRQYDRCLKALADDLEVPPMTETTALYEQIRAGKSV